MFADTQNINPISDNVAKLMNIHQHSTLNNNDSKTYFKYSGSLYGKSKIKSP